MARLPHPLITQLRAARKAQRLTQGVVAKRAHYSLSFLSNCEVGNTTPSLDTLTAWAAALGYDLVLTPRAGTGQPTNQTGNQ